MSILSRIIHRVRNDVFSSDGVGSLLPRGWLSSETRKRWVSENGLAHRVVWVIPQDVLSEKWTCNSQYGKDISELEDQEFNLHEKLFMALGEARQDGGAWLYLAADGDPEMPLVNGITKVNAIHDLTFDEVTVLSVSSDENSKNFGRPLFLSINCSRSGVTMSKRKVHYSRFVYIPGAPISRSARREKMGYDLSYLDLYRDALEGLDSSWRSMARLAERLSMPWLKVKGAIDAKAADENELSASGDGFAEAIALFKEGMSSNKLMVSVNDDEIAWVGPNTSGSRDLITIQAERMSAPEGVPLSRLLGQAPAGLSTDDASGNRTYNDLKQRVRTNILTPVLLSVYEKLYGPDNTRKIIWPPLEKLTAMEEAQVSNLRAQRDGSLIMSGVIKERESRARFEGSTEISEPVLSGELEEEEAMDENIDTNGVNYGQNV